MEIAPYLIFNGNCEAAFKFYEQVLGGKIEFTMNYGSSPEARNSPPEWKDKILHVRMSVRGGILMGSDAHPGSFEKQQGSWVSVSVGSVADAERVFKAFAENGSTVMPINKTFWAERFGMCVDRFGTHWMVNCEK
jgi:PhnB protein